jgi:hypothetical protein
MGGPEKDRCFGSPLKGRMLREKRLKSRCAAACSPAAFWRPISPRFSAAVAAAGARAGVEVEPGVSEQPLHLAGVGTLHSNLAAYPAPAGLPSSFALSQLEYLSRKPLFS